MKKSMTKRERGERAADLYQAALDAAERCEGEPLTKREAARLVNAPRWALTLALEERGEIRRPATVLKEARARKGADAYQAALDAGEPISLAEARRVSGAHTMSIIRELNARGELRRKARGRTPKEAAVARIEIPWRTEVRIDAAADLISLYPRLTDEQAARRYGVCREGVNRRRMRRGAA